MKAMIEISRNTARSIWEGGDADVYELLHDGSESLIADGDNFDYVTSKVENFGIEGEVFGTLYSEEAL
ncbi:hypothetical protein GCM10023084_53920 [Streptomyces lacrimifluminis]|uniref:Uncharacterized protein n=1 Tax=Streptomyces lacrimifluminis TaxID=1500077 RepID=A0A917L0W7_9ACTN|nr:hypothetical protein [Streptomyces lacrimifluminis]GGJ34395.1 hypothetical protein GCM10012282_33940 [Streptomyces lacrimifluminis]